MRRVTDNCEYQSGKEERGIMRKISNVIALVIVGLLIGVGLAFAEGQQEDEERTFISVTYGGDRQEAHRQYVADWLEERHPGLSVYLEPGLTQNVMSQIQAQRGASPYDVIPLGEPPAIEAAEAGWIITDLDYDRFENYDDISPAFKQEGMGVPATYEAIGVAYNPDEVSEPESWTDLWNEEYQGELAIATPESNLGWGFLLMASRVHGGDEENFDPGFEALNELDFIASPNPGSARQMLQRGEVSAAVLWHGDAALVAEESNIEFAMPEPGGIPVVSYFNIIDGSLNEDIAYEWLDRVMSVEYQEAAAALPYAFGVTNQNASVPEESRDWIPAADELEDLADFDWEAANPHRGEMTDRFITEFGE